MVLSSIDDVDGTIVTCEVLISSGGLKSKGDEVCEVVSTRGDEVGVDFWE